MSMDHVLVGDPVRKREGYSFPGEVRAVFTNRAGEKRVVVECIAPGVEGCLHIFSPHQLQYDIPGQERRQS